ncbi:MAG: hypothetical protein AAF213_09840 [Pseudomonadota bacterium]
MSETSTPDDQQARLSDDQVATAQQQLLTAAGRRQAAAELSAIMMGAGLDAQQASTIMEGSTGRNSPKKHAAAHTGRFLLETALRRDIEGLQRLVSLPFLFEETLCDSPEALAGLWFKAVKADGPPMASPDPYKAIYQVVANVDEFRELDPDEAPRLDNLSLSDDDFTVGMIIAVGSVAEAVNYILRWNGGAIKVAGIWT